MRAKGLSSAFGFCGKEGDFWCLRLHAPVSKKVGISPLRPPPPPEIHATAVTQNFEHMDNTLSLFLPCLSHPSIAACLSWTQ